MISYLLMMRFDHWVKNLFVLPGVALAIIIHEVSISTELILAVVLVLIGSSLIASANYLINEWLDRNFDARHPKKNMRPAAIGKVSSVGVLFFYLLLISLGLFLAYQVNFNVFICCWFFIISGIIYNVKPIRAKDIRIIDVLVESANNPIRLFIGWYSVFDGGLIPLSLILSYWLFGSFLMSCKRITDWKSFASDADRKAFRPSLGSYSERLLITQAFVYSSASTGLFLAFSVRYKFETILIFPLILGLMAMYLMNSLGTNSIASSPEVVMRKPIVILLLSLTILSFCLVLGSDFPILEKIFYKSF
mgnify:CR=1 FL=1